MTGLPSGHVQPRGKTAKRSKWMRKTRMCMYNLQGTCAAGSRCMFAHSVKELQDGPDLYKTQICEAFLRGNCTNQDCTFAHGDDELQPFPALKQKLCRWHQRGRCRNGDKCHFAHGLHDLNDESAVPIASSAESDTEREQPAYSSEASHIGMKSSTAVQQEMQQTLQVLTYLAAPTPARQGVTVCIDSPHIANKQSLTLSELVPDGKQLSQAIGMQKRTPLRSKAAPYTPSVQMAVVQQAIPVCPSYVLYAAPAPMPSSVQSLCSSSTDAFSSTDSSADAFFCAAKSTSDDFDTCSIADTQGYLSD